MANLNGFRGTAKRLDDVDLPRLGSLIRVGEDELHAFMDVESRGSGFDKLGRPKILFEMHKFYAHLPQSKRSQAEAQFLAAPRWGALPYGKESDQYPKLEKALKIDETAALKSCSWGMFQVLGENHRICGYDTVQAFVLAMMEDEENHLAACIQFLIANHLDDDLRAHRWEILARGYNGPGYKKNQYDSKLTAAYAKWQKIPDTKWSPDLGRPVPAPTKPPATPEKTAPIGFWSSIGRLFGKAA